MTKNLADRSVVVGVDGSPSARYAARWAADEAARRHVPLRLVHIVDIAGSAGSAGITGIAGNIAPPEGFSDALESEGRRQLTEAETEIRQAHPDLEVEAALHTASLVPTLISLSENAQLMAVGARGSGGFSGLLAGSTAIALVTHGHCPVAVLRDGTAGETPLPQGPVVVGVDGSRTSEPALGMAFEEAAMRGADLVAVHTWIEFASDTAYAAARQFFVDWKAVETNENEMLAERLAGWQEKYPDVAVRRAVTGGRPAKRLLQEAADAQLLVVGSRGRGGFAGMLLGSTSHALIHHAPCPLLVVRPGDVG